MAKNLDSHRLIHLLARLAVHMQRKKEWLIQLDSVAGDGDLGVTMELGFAAAYKEVELAGEETIGAVLVKAGLAFNKAASSTLGTLLATAMMRAGRELGSCNRMGVNELLAMGKAALQGIVERGGAKLGDKTILDALVPTVEAVEKTVKQGGDLQQALEAALTAARQGMAATEGMRPRMGRASWMAERSLGSPDPGAGALVAILEGAVEFAKNLPA